jgi:hypothetical protein
MPGLITFESEEFYFFKVARFIHIGRIFQQLNIILDKFFVDLLGWNKQKIMEKIELIRILIFVIVATHILACIFIYIGQEENPSWLKANDDLAVLGDFSV